MVEILLHLFGALQLGFKGGNSRGRNMNFTTLFAAISTVAVAIQKVVVNFLEEFISHLCRIALVLTCASAIIGSVVIILQALGVLQDTFWGQWLLYAVAPWMFGVYVVLRLVVEFNIEIIVWVIRKKLFWGDWMSKQGCPIPQTVIWYLQLAVTVLASIVAWRLYNFGLSGTVVCIANGQPLWAMTQAVVTGMGMVVMFIQFVLVQEILWHAMDCVEFDLTHTFPFNEEEEQS